MAASTSVQNMCNGTIVWARLANSPFWPAFVSTNIDPEDNKICVKFLADNGKLACLALDRIIVYEGLPKFQRYSMEMKREVSHFNSTSDCKTNQEMFALTDRLKTAVAKSKTQAFDK